MGDPKKVNDPEKLPETAAMQLGGMSYPRKAWRKTETGRLVGVLSQQRTIEGRPNIERDTEKKKRVGLLTRVMVPGPRDTTSTSGATTQWKGSIKPSACNSSYNGAIIQKV